MSDKTPPVRSTELEQTKSGLSHVETKEYKASTKPVFKCDKCGHQEAISGDILVKMEKDEDIKESIPFHCDEQMKIYITE